MSFSYLRALLITDPFLVLTTLVMGSISFVVSIYDAGGRRQHRVAQCWARLMLAESRVRVTLDGLENVDTKQNYVFVANHLSLMDTPVMLASLPVAFRFLAKASLFHIPFLGTHLRRAGHFPVVKEDARTSLRSMTDAARIAREQGLSVLLFPEGGRSEGELGDFKEGAAYIAIKAEIPIVPVGIVGTRKILPMGSIHVKGGPVELRFGQPIPTAGLTLKDRSKLTERVREEITGLLAHQSPRRRSRSKDSGFVTRPAAGA